MAAEDEGGRAIRLEVRDVSRRFGAVPALDRVSLTVGAGEIVALLGASGCGKSTLLRIVAGLERPDSGEVRLDGRDLAAAPPEARGIGLMFQDYALFPHITVGENVRFGLGGRARANARASAHERLTQVGLADRAAAYPGTLSGGESQRVALARALAPEPRLLLLDEPFSNLDRRTRDRVRDDTIALLRAARIAAILVTHDPEEALVFADRIALMRGGRLVQAGTGADLYRRPVCAFAARAFGETLELRGRCRSGHVETPLGPVPAPGLAEGAPARLCVRPEAIRVGGPGEGLPARVLRRSFAGPGALLHLAAEGIDGSFSLPVPHSAPHAEGDVVGLILAGPDAFAFPEEA